MYCGILALTILLGFGFQMNFKKSKFFSSSQNRTIIYWSLEPFDLSFKIDQMVWFDQLGSISFESQKFNGFIEIFWVWNSQTKPNRCQLLFVRTFCYFFPFFLDMWTYYCDRRGWSFVLIPKKREYLFLTRHKTCSCYCCFMKDKQLCLKMVQLMATTYPMHGKVYNLHLDWTSMSYHVQKHFD